MARMAAIKKRQKVLVDQWGREVAGNLLDDDDPLADDSRMGE